MLSINCHPFQASFICSDIRNKNTYEKYLVEEMGDGGRKETKTRVKHCQLCLCCARSELRVSKDRILKYKLLSCVFLLEENWHTMQHPAWQTTYINVKQVMHKLPLGSWMLLEYVIYKAIPCLSRPSQSSSLQASADGGMHSIILHNLLPHRWKPRFALYFFRLR